MHEGDPEHVPASPPAVLSPAISRRRLLAGGLAAAAVVAWGGTAARAAVPKAAAPRRLAFENLHTGEHLSATYWHGGRYDGDALAAIDRVLRDHRTGEVAPIDRRLLDLLHRLHAAMGSAAPFQVISGYRSPTTNAALAARSGGVARKSFHMQGMAIDIRLPGRPLSRVRDAALRMKAGGVGYYEKSDFVHVDVGPVRWW